MLDLLRSDGVRPCVPVGAPFLYLDPDREPACTGRRLLAFPMHGFEKAAITDVHRVYADYANSIEELARRIGCSDVSVCMYWFEHQDANLRSLFTSRGFTVTSNGHRDRNPDFLARLITTLREHSVVTANRICTALFYAMYLGIPGVLYGRGMGIRRGDDPFGEEHQKWEATEFPDLTLDRFDGSARSQLAEDELGQEFKLSPETLRELFGWSRSSSAIRLQRFLEHQLFWRKENLGRRLSSAIHSVTAAARRD